VGLELEDNLVGGETVRSRDLNKEEARLDVFYNATVIFVVGVYRSFQKNWILTLVPTLRAILVVGVARKIFSWANAM